MALVSLAIRNKGLVLAGIQNAKDNTTLESIILPIVKAVILYPFSFINTHLDLTL